MIISGKLINLAKLRSFHHKALPSRGGIGQKGCFDYLPRETETGNPMFGDGTAYPGPRFENGPAGAHLFTALRQLWRPAVLLARRDSFIQVDKLSGGITTYEVGPFWPEYRTIADRPKRMRHEFVCGALGADINVSRNANDEIPGEPPEWAISFSYAMSPIIAMPEEFRKTAPWKTTEAYLKQTCFCSHYHPEAGTHPILSDINPPNQEAEECFPRARYEEIGFCEIDFVNQLNPAKDDSNLKYNFPLYRDVWAEEHTAPEECGPSDGDPSSVRTVRVEIKLACFVWDTDKKDFPITQEMTEEIENPIDDNLFP